MTKHMRETSGLLICISFVCLLLSSTNAADIDGVSPMTTRFDHDATGFALYGAHQNATCNSCHVDGVFSGTPRSCNTCHASGSRINASNKSANHIRVAGQCDDCHGNGLNWEVGVTIDHGFVLGNCRDCHNNVTAIGKPPTHIQSNDQCDDCHTTSHWGSARFDHSNVTGSCFTCHNGNTAAGKSITHIQTSNQCDDCHTTIAWTPAVVDHNDPVISSKNCFSCHSGATATGKNPLHILSTNTCDDCHNNLSWTPVIQIDHLAVLGSCASCHNGTTATGKTPTHIQTTAACDSCHNTTNWTTVNFSHDNITGSCSNCHNNVIATGKSVNHFVTNVECDNCHRNISWTPDIFSHVSPNYPAGHSQNFQCNDCHLANSESSAWQYPSYQPDCAGCHADDYKSGPHKKYENPDVNYTVSELRDCTGSCHIYTDASLTTIKKNRNNEHRISSGEF